MLLQLFNIDSEKNSNFKTNFIHFVLVTNHHRHPQVNIHYILKACIPQKRMQNHEVENPCMSLFFQAFENLGTKLVRDLYLTTTQFCV
jgi:hypothetical protein